MSDFSTQEGVNMKSKQTAFVLPPLVTGFSASALAADTGFYGYQCTGTVYCGTANRSASGTSSHYGLGVDYAFAGNWFARAEYEVFTEVGDP